MAKLAGSPSPSTTSRQGLLPSTCCFPPYGLASSSIHFKYPSTPTLPLSPTLPQPPALSLCPRSLPVLPGSAHQGPARPCSPEGSGFTWLPPSSLFPWVEQARNLQIHKPFTLRPGLSCHSFHLPRGAHSLPCQGSLTLRLPTVKGRKEKTHFWLPKIQERDAYLPPVLPLSCTPTFPGGSGVPSSCLPLL